VVELVEFFLPQILEDLVVLVEVEEEEPLYFMVEMEQGIKELLVDTVLFFHLHQVVVGVLVVLVVLELHLVLEILLVLVELVEQHF
jgi:hypothetical protein